MASSQANNNNNSTNTKSKMCEPTLADLYELMSRCSSKEDIGDIKSYITEYKRETDEKIDEVNQKVENAVLVGSQNADKIDTLQASIEVLKQDQLKSNVCVSGVPPQLIGNSSTSDIIIRIAQVLGISINNNNFSSYAIANNKFIIVRFFNLKHKQQLINKIRVKRSLMVEECFEGTSNSQIYVNDHLTPYFNKLYLIARNAKKEGKLASATSFGGTIKARKNANDAPVTITYERQLLILIETEDALSTDNIQQADVMELSPTTLNRIRNKPATATRTAPRKKTQQRNTEERNTTKSIANKDTTTATKQQQKQNRFKRKADGDTTATAKKAKETHTYKTT